MMSITPRHREICANTLREALSSQCEKGGAFFCDRYIVDVFVYVFVLVK